MSLNNDISDLYRRKEVKKLQVITEGLNNRKEELDEFFEEFLEVFEEKMNATLEEQKGNPIWDAYKARYKEWSKINADLKMAKYYLGML